MPTFRFLSLFCSLLASTASANFPHHRGDGTRLWEQTGTNALHVWIRDLYEERDGKVLFHIIAEGHRVCTFEPAAGGITGYNPTNQEFYFYHPDYLGSSSLMTERNGTQVQHYEYSAFGQSRFTQSSTAFHVSRRYTGQILDEDTGLYYYNFRYYIPELARFGQPDDIIPDLSNPQSWNRYSYCIDNPLRFTDPTGHETYWEGVGNVFLGYYDAGSGVVKGTVFVFAHPITTVEGLGTAVAHPISTGEAIASGVAADWNSGTRGQGKLVGGILIAVGAAVAPAAEAGNLSKAGEIANVGSKVESSGAAAEKASLLPARYDPQFAAEQILGGPAKTPGGRTIMDHAARRMTDPPPGRGALTMGEVDKVLDTGNKIKKITPHSEGTTVTVQHTGMPGKPQVVVDAATGKKVITVIKDRPK